MHAIITIPTTTLDLPTIVRHNLPMMGFAVLEGFIREGNTFHVTKVVDITGSSDTRTPYMGSGNDELLSWEMRELFAHHLAASSAELYGALHLLTFTGMVVFS